MTAGELNTLLVAIALCRPEQRCFLAGCHFIPNIQPFPDDAIISQPQAGLADNRLLRKLDLVDAGGDVIVSGGRLQAQPFDSWPRLRAPRHVALRQTP